MQDLPKKPVTSHIRAANSTTIEVLGLVNLPVLLKGRELVIRGVASDHNDEMLLGIEWLEKQRAIWDMRSGELYMHGSVFPLKAKRDGGWVCRVEVQEAVHSPRSQTNVLGRTVYRDLADTCDTWVSKPGSPSDELRVARAVVPNRCKNFPIRVMNVAGYSVVLPTGTVLADLEAVAMMADIRYVGARLRRGRRQRHRERGGT